MTKAIKKDTIHAGGIDIGIYTTDFKNEYISLTDIVKYRSIQPSITIMLNIVLFGKTAREWKSENPNKKGNMRDYASIHQL